MTIGGSLDKIHEFDGNYGAFRNHYNDIVRRFANSSFLSPNLTHQARAVGSSPYNFPFVKFYMYWVWASFSPHHLYSLIFDRA